MSARSMVVPAYQLYGETSHEALPDIVHVEEIKDRGSLHGWRIDPHRHYGLSQILWIRSAGTRVSMDSKSFILNEEAILIVPQSVVHGFLFKKDAFGAVFTAPSRLLRIDDGEGRAVDSPPIVLRRRERGFAQFAQALAELRREFHDRADWRDQALLGLLSILRVWIRRLAESEGRRVRGESEDSPGAGDEKRVRLFLQLVEANYFDGWSIQDYANAIGISSAQLSRDCRTLAERSPLQILHDRVVAEAKRKLAYTVLSVSQISEDLGFSDVAYFSRFFKQRAGAAPAAYRARVREGFRRSIGGAQA